MRTRTTIFSLGCLLLGLGPLASAADRDAPDPRSATQESPEFDASLPRADATAAGFDSLDTDRSGSIDNAEARFMPELAQEFERWDHDHSGTVNATEFRSFMERPG